jgi:hypothetical protein
MLGFSSIAGRSIAGSTASTPPASSTFVASRIQNYNQAWLAAYNYDPDWLNRYKIPIFTAVKLQDDLPHKPWFQSLLTR